MTAQICKLTNLPHVLDIFLKDGLKKRDEAEELRIVEVAVPRLDGNTVIFLPRVAAGVGVDDDDVPQVPV